MRFRVPAVAAVVLAAALPAAAEDLTIVSKVTRDGAPPSTATSYLSSDHARMVQPDGQEAILDLGTGQITVIDGRKKEYFVITRQDMEQMKSRLQQLTNSPEMQRAQEQMKNLPPEIQKKMQGMMGAAGGFDVQKTGTTRKIAGYTCENWVVTLGQFSKTEQCMTTELPVPVQTWDAYRDFAEGMRGMMASMGPMGKGMAEVAAKMRDMRGFPLALTTSSNFMGRSMNATTEVVEVKKGSIPASAWALPEGYRKVDNPMLKGMK
jgi:uncharacterized protein DUF4412